MPLKKKTITIVFCLQCPETNYLPALLSYKKSGQTRCPMCSMASAILLSMSSSELDSMFSSAVRACFPPLSPCATIMALMTSSQPRLSGSFASHSRMYSMSFNVTHSFLTGKSKITAVSDNDNNIYCCSVVSIADTFIHFLFS